MSKDSSYYWAQAVVYVVFIIVLGAIFICTCDEVDIWNQDVEQKGE